MQPLEALTRPLRPGKDGSFAETRSARDESPRARAPEPEVDTLAPLRHTALWASILGGAALLLALMLRPVLARRAADLATTVTHGARLTLATPRGDHARWPHVAGGHGGGG